MHCRNFDTQLWPLTGLEAHILQNRDHGPYIGLIRWLIQLDLLDSAWFAWFPVRFISIIIDKNRHLRRREPGGLQSLTSPWTPTYWSISWNGSSKTRQGKCFLFSTIFVCIARRSWQFGWRITKTKSKCSICLRTRPNAILTSTWIAAWNAIWRSGR